ncbi:shikimate kinase [Flavobacterium suaedae]|nr:shikimate kinase [Flavobacterium suaedae]
MKIVLCGYMGSGKSIIAKLLSKALTINSIDLDEYIEKQQGKTISHIFEESGEVKFRKLEHEALKEIMNGSDDFLLAMGGGTPCYAGNDKFLKQNDVISIYLKTGIKEIVKRLTTEIDKRPLLKNLDEEEREEFVAKHIFDRSYYYMQSKHVVTTDGKTPEAIVNEIMSLL